jgi:hypothetical protein
MWRTRIILIYLLKKINNMNLIRKKGTAKVDFNKESMVKLWTKSTLGKGRS